MQQLKKDLTGVGGVAGPGFADPRSTGGDRCRDRRNESRGADFFPVIVAGGIFSGPVSAPIPQLNL